MVFRHSRKSPDSTTHSSHVSPSPPSTSRRHGHYRPVAETHPIKMKLLMGNFFNDQGEIKPDVLASTGPCQRMVTFILPAHRGRRLPIRVTLKRIVPVDAATCRVITNDALGNEYATDYTFPDNLTLPDWYHSLRAANIPA